MRLEPIESTRNPVLRLLNWAFRRQFGRTLTPYQVVFARLPRTIAAQLGIYWGLGGGHGIPPELQVLLQSRVAAMNGCSFCLDIGRAMATYRGLTLEKVDAVHEWRTSPLFTDAERAALAYVEEASRDRRVSDETFAALRAHFDDRQIVGITWLNAVENYFNLINGPLGIESDGLCAIADRRVGTRRAPASPELARRSA
jgi:AhpD family alkylhydroperoxidase